MKPFDLEKAKKGAAVCLRDGTPVKILDFDYSGKILYKFVHHIENNIEYPSMGFANYEGTATTLNNKRLPNSELYDLFMVPVFGYMCIYLKDKETLTGGDLHTDMAICAIEREQNRNAARFEFRYFAKVELLDE